MSCKNKWHAHCQTAENQNLAEWELNQRTNYRDPGKFDWGYKNGQSSFNLAVRLELRRRRLLDASVVYPK